VQWMLNPFRSPSEPLLNVLFDGVVEADALMSRHMVRPRYFRLNPPLTQPTSLDDWKAIPELIKTADSYDLTPAFEWIEKHWN